MSCAINRCCCPVSSLIFISWLFRVYYINQLNGLTFAVFFAKRSASIWQALCDCEVPWQTVADTFSSLFAFSSLSGHAPPYLADDIHLGSEGHQRRLRSSTDRPCAVPRTHNTFGDRSFAVAGVAGPRVWNSLPSFGPLARRGHYKQVSGVNSKRFCFNVASGAQWEFC